MGIDRRISAYYAQGRERDRLKSGTDRLEYLRSRELLGVTSPSPRP